MRTTLGEQARVFARRPTPWLLAGAVVGGAALRLALAPVRATDAVVALTVALAQPFVEWLIHVNVLHAKPFTLLGRTVDVGASHRVHHAAPRDLDHVFVDVRFLAAALGAVALVWATRPGPLLGTGLVVAPAGVLAYEWTHFLVHTAYAPRTAAYRRVRRAHLLHHFRDERAWFGVTTPVADLVLGTYRTSR
jgi:hypothetical protein